MVDEFYSPNLNSEKILQESLEEVKSILEKLDTAVYKVRDYLLINETITEKETKKIIDEVF